MNGSAIRATEDAARRRFAAARAESGSTERARAILQQVDIALDGRIDSVKNGRIRNTFEAVPDAPVTKFTLEMKGGKKGLLVNSTNLCKSNNHAISEFTGQNGKIYDTNPVVSAPCSKGKKHKKH